MKWNNRTLFQNRMLKSTHHTHPDGIIVEDMVADLYGAFEIPSVKRVVPSGATCHPNTRRKT